MSHLDPVEKQELIAMNTENPSPISQSLQSNPGNSNDGAVVDDLQIQWLIPVPPTTYLLLNVIDNNNKSLQAMDDQQVTIKSEHLGSPKRKKSKMSPETNIKQTPLIKKNGNSSGLRNDPTKLETSVTQVKKRLKQGCKCQDESCFSGLNPESVYKHRLNIAELTNAEHDMYLMGVIMACLGDPDKTMEDKDRERLRTHYIYKGRQVCFNAFLYLENCNCYYVKRIRKHVITNGVTPRVHGNHGKKPPNTLSLHIYRHAIEFLKQYFEKQLGGSGIGNSKRPITLPWYINKKNVHDAYKKYGQILEPAIKLMGYTSFSYLLREQFPHIKFSKDKSKYSSEQQQKRQKTHQESGQQMHTHVMQKPHQIQTNEQPQEQEIQKTSPIGNSKVLQQVVPLIVAPSGDVTNQHNNEVASSVTSVPPQIIQSTSTGSITDGQEKACILYI